MFRLLTILLVTQFVVGFPQEKLFSDAIDSVELEDVADDDYDMEAEFAKQASVDDRIEAALIRNANAAGYPLETHYTETEDGYILAIHRIPYSQSNRNVQNKPVVFLQHGLLSCSLHYTTQGPGKALAYLLADQGYDVWMGNVRGNTFSKYHVKLNPKKAEFWNFSWNEIGYYDLPAMIDYVLKNTHQDALNYVGHSQGTTSFFVMTSTRPEYNKKIKAMHALAPVAYMSNIDNPFVRILAPLVGKGSLLTNVIGGFEFLPSSKLLAILTKIICKDGSIIQGVCTNTLFLIAGFSPENTNATMLPEILQTTPAGASINQLIHYAQEVNSGKFRKFDYGLTKNFLTYGSISPPNYNLSKVTAPVHLYYSINDWLASVKDVQNLASQLPNLVFNKRVQHGTFNHFDFLWGIYAYDLVYSDLIDNIKRYT